MFFAGGFNSTGMKLKKLIDPFFVLSKSERNGALVLFVLIVLLVVFRFCIPLLFHHSDQFKIDYDQKIAQLEKIKDSIENSVYSANRKIINKGLGKESNHFQPKEILPDYDKKEIHKTEPRKLFKFDPNSVSYNDLIDLGFTTFAASNLINYRDKGGTFNSKADVKKIYGVDSLLFLRVQAYIEISPKTVKPVIIDLNRADSAQFTLLEGIGPVYASRICKFRNRLGGYVSVMQLKEVYQFPEETYNTIVNKLEVDLSCVKKINVNFADLSELKKHPYCNYAYARRIIDYRSGKGYIDSVQQLLADSVIPPQVYEKLSLYLVVK